SSFQQHGQLRPTGPFEKREVLHIASADLDHISVLFDKIDTGLIECFRDDLQSKGFADLHHDFPALVAQSLKRVGCSSWLPNTAAKKTGTAFLHRFSHSKRLIATLYLSWYRYYRVVAVADGSGADY